MMTKVMTKSSKNNQRTTQVNQRSIKNNSRVQDMNQEEFKTQEESLETRIKIQGSRSQESRSRFKTQEKTQSR
ncbi:hypothetical protein HKD37_09G025031 [Glycine soja]